MDFATDTWEIPLYNWLDTAFRYHGYPLMVNKTLEVGHRIESSCTLGTYMPFIWPNIKDKRNRPQNCTLKITPVHDQHM